MIRDFGSGEAALPDYDVCIVGSGPAGMTLAVELADSGLRVAVLESGRLRTSAPADALRALASEGIAIKEWSRERVFGGTSTTWAGLSSPLDPIDFGPRPFAAPGWPLAREALLPYWERAARRYRFAPLRLYGPEGFGALKGRGDASLAWRELDEKIFLACSEPQDFGREHRAAVEGEGVDLWLDATVLRLERGAAGAGGGGAAGAGGAGGAPRVAHAAIAASNGRHGELRAAAFVLAAGGIENARLLLVSRDLCAAGLGNEHDQVGRGLMNHPKNYHGVIRLARPVRELPYHFGCLHHGYAGYAGLRLAEARQAELRCLNSYVRFEPLFPWSDNRGVEAFVLIAKRSKGLLRGWKQRREGEVVELRDYSETGDDSDLQNERKSLLGWIGIGVLVLLNAVVVARYLASRLLQGRAPLIRNVRLRNFMEMEPHADNRVTLGEATDAFGQPRAVVRHQTTALDRRSLVALHEALAGELAGNGFGTLESGLAARTGDGWPIDQDASHHMGTTRMGRDPATSVVDANCRLHGAENVYVAGASVFPTSGCANPTFTLVALAIRLADHLRVEVFEKPPAQAAQAAAAAAARTEDRAEGEPARARAPLLETDGGRRVLVLGAGKRVQTDVLPALAALAGRYALAGLYARSDRVLTVGGHEYPVRAIQDLRADDLRPGDLVYLAVSKDAVPGALARLVQHDLSAVDLLIDTPVLLFKHVGHAQALSAFRRVWVAEDCATLPWIETVRAASEGPVGELRELRFDRSAWHYHALALMKTLLGDPRIVRARRRGTGPKSALVEVELSRGGRATVVEPRDYGAGHFVLTGSRATVTDAAPGTAGAPAPAPGGGLHRLEMVVSGGLCSGFRIGDVVTRLEPVEQHLLGPASAAHTLTSRTEDLKRIGLYRMLRAIAADGEGYPLEAGLDDMAIDWWLERTGRYRATPFTRVGAAPAKLWMGAMTKVAGRG